ncbi:MAG TPA: hypothetical protein VHM70_31120 [Polyangiaceae bacterium]|jgi:hypothetical protein|nr:hypothetical protein [Polyangiaceae bacterium]
MRRKFDGLKDRLEAKVWDGVRAAADLASRAANATRAAREGSATEVEDTSTPSEQKSAQNPLTRSANSTDTLEALKDDPPVVARLIVEIRSDGSRTVARGALKDELSGEQVTLVARGNTPLQLAAELTRSLLTMPFTAGQLARNMLGARNAKSQSKSAKSSNEATRNESGQARSSARGEEET